MSHFTDKLAAAVAAELKTTEIREILFESYLAGKILPGQSRETVAALTGLPLRELAFETFEGLDDKSLQRHYRNYMSRAYADTNKRFRPNSAMPGLTKRTEAYVLDRFALLKKAVEAAPLPYEFSEPRYLGDRKAYQKLTAALLSAVVDGKIKPNGTVRLARSNLCVLRFGSEIESLFTRDGSKLTLECGDIESASFTLAFFSALDFHNSGNKRLFLQKLHGCLRL